MEPTKRKIVSMVGRFYDPIGVLSPVVVSLKVQEICESHMEWDQPLEEPQARKWHELVTELRQAQPILVPKGYFNVVNGQAESNCLYDFCDALKKAYTAVIYLVIRTPTKTCAVCCLEDSCGIHRSHTIPRLELNPRN